MLKSESKTSFDPTNGSVAIVDRDDLLLCANSTFYETADLGQAATVGRPLFELLHADGKWEACVSCLSRRKALSPTQMQPASNTFENRISIDLHDIRAQDGKAKGIVLVIRDLSIMESSNPASAEAITLIKPFVDTAYDAIYATDLDGRFLFANKRAADLFEIDASAIQGVPYLKSLRTHELDRVREVFELASRGDAQRFEAQFVTRDGDARDLQVTNSPVYSGDNIVAVLGIVRDVTEERQEAEQTMRSDKLRALGQLAWGIAHNFNNSLTAVLGYTQLVLRKNEDPVFERHLKTVEQAALDAAKMVQRIQNFARQSKEEQWGAVDLNQTIRDSLDLTRSRWRDDARAAGIEYDVSFRPEEGMVRLCDQSAMREVFVGIIINALDAMPGGGRLLITTAVERDDLVVSFTDSGSGMTGETRKRIFEPFYTTKGAKGHGLGLAVTYGIIERHGGNIEVNSKPGSGSTFTIRLKRSPDAISAPVETPNDRPALPSSILVVDDEAPIRILLSDMLRARGHEVTTAGDGLEGLKAIENTRFDLLITDLSMPGADGWTVASEARRRWPDMKLIIVTGYGGSAELAVPGGDKSIIDALISKPFNIAEIDLTINRLLAGA